ncbi:MAG TPA: hypothetical protein VI258_14745, partial [Rhodanobacteraceae bacterium]
RQHRMRIARLMMCAAVLAASGAAAATHIALSGESAGAEVCRFRAGDAENPFGRWLRSPDVTCVAGNDLNLPAGLWNVFAKSRSGISIEPLLIDAAAKSGSIDLSLVPAAALHVQLPPETAGVLYVPRRAAGYPVTERTLVPGGEDLWLIIVSKTSPVAVLQIPAIAAGNERIVDARNAPAEGAILGWLHVSAEDRAALASVRGVHAPQIVATSGGKTHEALPLPDLDVLGGAFVLLRDVPPGAAELQLARRGWLTRRQPVLVEAHRLTALTEPIIAAASTTLVVNWSVPNNVGALDRSIGSCDASREQPKFTLTMSLCPPPKKGEASPDCQPVKTEALPIDQTFGTVRIEETPPGTYRAEIRYGKLPPVSDRATLPPLLERPMFLTASYFEANGNLTRGDEPLHDDASIAFPGGGAGFSTRDSGEYHAVLTQPLGVDAKIDVTTCNGDKAFVLADRPLFRNARFDIDIPGNSLSITLSDTFTRMNVNNADVRVQIMNKTSRFPLLTTTYNGPAVSLRGLPERQLRIEVTAHGYKTKDLDPFSIGRSEKKELDIQLEPLSGRQGLLVSSHPFQNATIFWFSASGSEIERADVAADGTFSFDADHYRDETMSVVSASHPLWITRPPQAERGRTLEVRFPDSAPVRQAEVSLPHTPPRLTTVLGIAIGGLRVPQPLLAQHQAMRKSTTVIAGEGPLVIPALAETGPIDILRGASIFAAPQMLEFLAVRDFAPVAVKRLEPGSAAVVFK